MHQNQERRQSFQYNNHIKYFYKHIDKAAFSHATGIVDHPVNLQMK